MYFWTLGIFGHVGRRVLSDGANTAKTLRTADVFKAGYSVSESSTQPSSSTTTGTHRTRDTYI
jgi:hypothetical protein